MSHRHHICLINDLSTASITQHETHKTYTVAMAIKTNVISLKT